MENSSKKHSYVGKKVFVGIDVHKRTYSVVAVVLDFGQNEKVFACGVREQPLKLNKMNLAQCFRLKFPHTNVLKIH